MRSSFQADKMPRNDEVRIDEDDILFGDYLDGYEKKTKKKTIPFEETLE